MRGKIKTLSKTLLVVLAAVIVVVPLQIAAHATDTGSDQTQTQTVSSFQFKYPTQHTFAEINQYYSEHPYDTELPDEYDAIPDIANEEINNRIGEDTLALCDDKGKADRDTLAGSLSQATLTNALNATNYMRYSAGLQLLYIHTNDRIGGYQWRAQAGAALMAELGVITHNVSGTDANAAGIVNGVFGWAKAGPGGSNIVAGYGVANKMVNSFMPDIGNDGTGLSHRSYILNPALSGTGFGAANLSGKNKAGGNRGSAVAMFVTYFGSDPDGITAIQWPSNRQPIETFLARGTWTMAYPENNPYQGNPWSYYINTGSATVDTSKFKVTLECDGKPTDVLDYNNIPESEKSENRIWTTGSYGLKRLVAFRPHVAYDAGDKVTVTIEGIVDSDNLPIPVTYDVHFFATGTEPHPNLETASVVRGSADLATFKYTSDYAGSMYYLLKDADQSEPTAEEVLAGTKVAIEAGEKQLEISGVSGSSSKRLYYITASTTAEGKDYATASASGEMSDVKSTAAEMKVNTITGSGTFKVNGATMTDGSTQTISSGDTLNLSWQPAKVGSTNLTLIKSITVNSKDQQATTKIDKSKWQVVNEAYAREMGDSTALMTTYDQVASTEQSISVSTANASGDVTIDVEFAEYVPVYRLYNKITSEHLFTTNKTEYDNFVNQLEAGADVWIGEGIDWFAEVTPETANDNTVRRFYNAALGAMGSSSHYYSKDATEIATLLQNGWVDDGPANYIQSGGDVPIWTCYNEALGSAHHYTSNKTEWEGLEQNGWALEKDKNGVDPVKTLQGAFQAVMSAKP